MDCTIRRHRVGQQRADRTRPPALSPLGTLYQSEVQRLARLWPDLEPAHRAYLVTLSLARAFLDVTPDDLNLAMSEGDAWLNSLTDGERADITGRTAAWALGIARRERQETGGPIS